MLQNKVVQKNERLVLSNKELSEVLFYNKLEKLRLTGEIPENFVLLSSEVEMLYYLEKQSFGDLIKINKLLKDHVVWLRREEQALREGEEDVIDEYDGNDGNITDMYRFDPEKADELDKEADVLEELLQLISETISLFINKNKPSKVRAVPYTREGSALLENIMNEIRGGSKYVS